MISVDILQARILQKQYVLFLYFKKQYILAAYFTAQGGKNLKQ
jgi:hypothetical protein